MESKSYNKKRRFWNVIAWTSVVLVVLCMIAFIILLIMLGRGSTRIALFGGLLGGALAGVFLFGGIVLLAFKRTERLSRLELDALEREDSENSFFVGEGTLATFEERALRIHGGVGNKTKSFSVPYSEIRFFSVCTRRSPKNKGEWNVVFEIPAHYFNRSAKKSDPAALIQTDGKERLYALLQKFGFELIGEKPHTDSSEEFTRLTSFLLPDSVKRKRALILLVVGVLLFIGGFSAIFLWERSISAICLVFGFYIATRAALAYTRAKAVFSVYKEGIYYREPSGMDNVFLKWEEFSDVSIFEQKDVKSLRVMCPYGAYEFPVFDGAYEYIKERFPEKCEK